MRWNKLVLVVLALMALAPVSSLRADFQDDFDIGDLQICPNTDPSCETINCEKECENNGVNIAECPLYCNTFTQNKFLVIPIHVIGLK